MKCYIISDNISDFSDTMDFESEHICGTRSSAEDGLIRDHGSVGPMFNHITRNNRSLQATGNKSS